MITEPFKKEATNGTYMVLFLEKGLSKVSKFVLGLILSEINFRLTTGSSARLDLLVPLPGITAHFTTVVNSNWDLWELTVFKIGSC